MSSSQPFVASSPLSDGAPPGGRRKSRFTYKHLSQLGLYSATCPLRVIAHIDLDAFYAQCEMIRLDVPEDQPLAVQQWQGLIAINYPARAFGLSRHVTTMEAKKLCPQLIMQHVATWKEGDQHWAYRDDAANHIATHKVSLDPYRMESRKILSLIKETLPNGALQRVEKASIDEVFLDLSAQIHSILLERYPELSGPPPYDDPTENLPRPPTTVLDWTADAMVDLDESESEQDDPDWDDITMNIGSEIVRSVRKAIREHLKYTCSAGVAQNKMLAKLGSAHKKPNQQTIIRNRAIQHFLSGFKFTKIRNLGGKLGDQVVGAFDTDTVKDLLEAPIEQLKSKLGDDTGSWIYHVIRGVDHSEVNPRTQIKSMLSAKSFRPSINTPEQAERWLRIFVADIFSRLVEEGVLDNKRRPKTINLHHRQGGQVRSRQAPIPQGRPVDEKLLFQLAKDLFGQVRLEGKVWPCANLMLSVAGFEDGVSGNKGIGSFLLKGEEARAINQAARASPDQSNGIASASAMSDKRRRVEEGGIQKFFLKQEASTEDHDEDFGALEEPQDETEKVRNEESSLGTRKRKLFFNEESSNHRSRSTSRYSVEPGLPAPDQEGMIQQRLDQYFCERCKQSVAATAQIEHDDWHLAMDLQAQDHHDSDSSSRPGGESIGTAAQSRSGGRSHRGRSISLKGQRREKGGSGSGAGGSLEKGQSRLAFGT